MTNRAESGDHDLNTTPLIRPRRSAVPDVPILRVLAGRDALRFAVIVDGIEIGRDATCALILNDSSVSRRHARITAEHGGFAVADLGSRNGTLLNGRQVHHERLNPGDRLEAGAVPLRFDMVSPDELNHLQGVLERLQAGDRDPLTGLHTRAYLDEDLPARIEDCARASWPLTAAFIDVDCFKSINDQFGHGIGDDVLRQVAHILAYAVRTQDACVRYGGEEIVVILEGVTESHGVVVTDRVRQLVESHEWPAIAKGLVVTVSCGVAQRRDGEEIREWLDRADRALYAAKRAGRNRVGRASQIDDATDTTKTGS